MCMSSLPSEAAGCASELGPPAPSCAVSFGPGGLVARMSKTDRAICLLARLTLSPRLCLDCMLLRPKDISLMGRVLAGREPSGCQDRAGGSLSCQDCRPFSLVHPLFSSPFELAGCAVLAKGWADAANMEGGILAPDIGYLSDLKNPLTSRTCRSRGERISQSF